jgi:hypothetical protein
VQQESLDGWRSDVARAFIAWILFVGSAGFTLVSAWSVGVPALILFVLILIFGPFVASGVACRVVPAVRPLEVTMGAGILFGLFFFLILGAAGFKFMAARYHGGGTYVYIPLVLPLAGPFVGALAFSRLKLRSSA